MCTKMTFLKTGTHNIKTIIYFSDHVELHRFMLEVAFQHKYAHCIIKMQYQNIHIQYSILLGNIYCIYMFTYVHYLVANKNHPSTDTHVILHVYLQRDIVYT